MEKEGRVWPGGGPQHLVDVVVGNLIQRLKSDIEVLND